MNGIGRSGGDGDRRRLLKDAEQPVGGGAGAIGILEVPIGLRQSDRSLDSSE